MGLIACGKVREKMLLDAMLCRHAQANYEAAKAKFLVIHLHFRSGHGRTHTNHMLQYVQDVAGLKWHPIWATIELARRTSIKTLKQHVAPFQILPGKQIMAPSLQDYLLCRQGFAKFWVATSLPAAQQWMKANEGLENCDMRYAAFMVQTRSKSVSQRGQSECPGYHFRRVRTIACTCLRAEED